MRRKQLRTNDPNERIDTDTREVFITLEETETGLVVGIRVDVVIHPEDNDPQGAD
jgi:hypothetical protein